MTKTGFDVAETRASLPGDLDFNSVSSHVPSDIQRAAAEAPGPIVVLEAETGSGKTEAALWRFVKLFADGRVDGLYFALPTRVAWTLRRVRYCRCRHGSPARAGMDPPPVPPARGWTFFKNYRAGIMVLARRLRSMLV